MIYLKLFLSFFQIGLFAIGGGYAAMPLIQNQVVVLNDWLTMDEFIDLVTIAEMTPGPIAINAATFVGTRIGGLPGAIISTIGCVTPSLIIVITLAWLYSKYREMPVIKNVLSCLRPAVIALIASAGLGIIKVAFWGNNDISGNVLDINLTAVILFALSIYILRKLKPNPIYIMFGTGVIGMIVYSLL